jgi:hypothetical protein
VDPLGLTSSAGISSLAKNLSQHSPAFHINDFVSKGIKDSYEIQGFSSYLQLI